MLLKREQTMNRLSRLLRPALLVAVLVLMMGAIVQAAGSATIRDDAGLFTARGRSAIERAAEQNNVRVVVITNKQRFPSLSAWHAWLRSQATDPNAITIGLHVGPKNVYVVPGANTGISQGQAKQGFRDAQRTFNSAGPAEGVIQMIQDYHRMGATAPGGSASPGGSHAALARADGKVMTIRMNTTARVFDMSPTGQHSSSRLDGPQFR
jgi:hypothetical protein